MDPNNIVWNAFHTPVSRHFDDVYFSNDDAIAETKYVFIEGNQLIQRFLSHQTSTLVIGETGFGSGLNFLLVWQLFNLFRQNNPTHPLTTLQFYSIEKYPLSIIEMQQIHQAIVKQPELQPYCQRLQQYWLYHEQYLAANIELKILFADIEHFADFLSQQAIMIDVWFFDGFSPNKNPDMWSETLFKQLYHLTNDQGTFATFTAAGFVRRNLIQAGFTLQKRKGYGHKREMLTGIKVPSTSVID